MLYGLVRGTNFTRPRYRSKQEWDKGELNERVEWRPSCGFGEQRLALTGFIKDGDDVFSTCQRLE